jgi:competence protein ComEC
MLMPKCGFYFNLLYLVTAVLELACFSPYPDISDEMHFCVIDGGQGLAQICSDGSQTVVFDIGLAEAFHSQIKKKLVDRNSPIASIILSHRDLDHCGGLQFIDSTINWTGNLVMSKYEDTAYIRSLCKKWVKPITIRTICKGDTLKYFENIEIRCIWPPDSSNTPLPVTDEYVNTYSLVFLVRYHNTQVLISSDIDSTAANIIAVQNKQALRSEILVVPHHGSGGSLSHNLLGFIRPEIAIISCAAKNIYNHPSDTIIKLLMQSGADLRCTYLDGTVSFRSNGYYWR